MDGWTPLHSAACAGQLNVCKMLIEEGAIIDAVEAHHKVLDCIHNVLTA
jgi:ankyrin repeat protein